MEEYIIQPTTRKKEGRRICQRAVTGKCNRNVRQVTLTGRDADPFKLVQVCPEWAVSH